MIVGILRTSAHSISQATTDNHQPFSTSVVFYDGVCALCSRAVQYLLEKDRHHVLKFAPLQGQTARPLLERFPELAYKKNLKSVIYIREFNSPDEQIFLRADAVLQILSDLEVQSPWITGMSFFPRFLRNLIYNVVAKFRYRWFGKYRECWLPDFKWRERFLP